MNINQVDKLLDQIPAILWKTDVDLNLIYLNKEAEDYTGVSHESLYGNGWTRFIYPEDITAYYKACDYALSHMERIQYEIRLGRYDGEYRWFLIVGSPYYDEEGNFCGYIGDANDLEEHKAAEVILKRYEIFSKNSQAKYRSLFMNMKSGYAFYKTVYNENNELIDVILLEVNDKYLEFFGLKEENIIGKTFSELFPNSYKTIIGGIRDNEKVLLKGESFHINDYYSECYNRWFSLVIYSPEPGKIVTIVSDITDSKQSEMKLIAAKEAAEAANRAKSEFLANMSHEIRTPINGMLGMIDLTLLTSLTQDQKDKLKMAKECANNLLNIIDDILDFSKMEAGKIRIQENSFDIQGVVQAVIKTHNTMAEKKGIKLLYEISEEIPRFLIGDQQRIFQILNNLFSNAVKFTNQGYIKLTVEYTPSEEGEYKIRFSVEDTGIGIAEENIINLFKSFSQVEGTFTKHYSGTGLGLAISKQLVEMMGGRIGVVSKKGEGSTFYFIINFNPGEPYVENDQFCQKQPDMVCYNILLVEDDPVNRKVITELLKEKGHRVKPVGTGREAVSEFEKSTYDMILMDIQMPDLDGIDTAKKIRSMGAAGLQVPIIAITAYALSGDREKFIELGMNGYVSKPIQLEQLYREIDVCMSPVSDNQTIPKGNCQDFNEIDLDLKVMESAVSYNNPEIILFMINEIKELARRAKLDDIYELINLCETALKKGNKNELIALIDRCKKLLKV